MFSLFADQEREANLDSLGGPLALLDKLWTLQPWPQRRRWQGSIYNLARALPPYGEL